LLSLIALSALISLSMITHAVYATEGPGVSNGDNAGVSSGDYLWTGSDDNWSSYDEDPDVSAWTLAWSLDECPNDDLSADDHDGFCGDFTPPSDEGSVENSAYSLEFNDAYQYAYHVGITTMPTIQEANMWGQLIRAHMAKMMASYAINVKGLEPDTSLPCNFTDIANQSTELKWYIKLACQLNLMGVGLQKFDPNGIVTRAQFGTILSRVIRWGQYNGGTPYYADHLQALKEAGVVNNITDPEHMMEQRWYVMLMMRRAENDI
jgi:hypothetical protein